MKSDSKLPHILVTIFVVFGFLFLAMSVPRFLPAEPDFAQVTKGAVLSAGSILGAAAKDMLRCLVTTLVISTIISVIPARISRYFDSANFGKFKQSELFRTLSNPFGNPPVMVPIKVENEDIAQTRRKR